MPIVEYKGSFYEVDGDGALIDPAKWDKNWACYVAETEGIAEPTDDHYVAIEAMQAYAEKYSILSLIGYFPRCTRFPLWRIHQLFTSEPRRVAFKMAGLRRIC